MRKKIISLLMWLSAAVLIHVNAWAADAMTVASTPPATGQELEAAYATAIEGRSEGILKALALNDAAKSNRLHNLIITYYHALRARDEVIDARLRLIGQPVNYANRASDLLAATKSLHDQFLANLAKELTPEQIESVKDRMTYSKVKVTYDAYCAIVPGLTDADKAKIQELLKAAREEAMDGGSAPEKSAIFKKYKDQINDYLNTHGHDVIQAYRDWNAAHPGDQDTNVVPATAPAK